MKRYSMVEARDNFAAILQDLDTTGRVEITRRGQPVAILLSYDDYERLKPRSIGFRQAYQRLRKELNLSQLNIDPTKVFGGLR